MLLDDCCLIELPKISDSRGHLTFIEGGNQIPFEIRRVYYLYGMPDGAERGDHAHKALHQIFIAISGHFDVVLDDGQAKKCIHLDRPDRGLYVGPMIWHDLTAFSLGAVCMALTSDHYDEADYYRVYGDFLGAQGLD